VIYEYHISYESMWLITIESAFIAMGSYFFFDSLYILQSLVPLSSYQYGIILSITSIPNIILSILSSLIIYQLGNSLSALIFNTLIILGAVIFTTLLTLSITNIIYLSLSAFILGLGSESIYIIQSTMLVNELNKDKLPLSMSISTSLTRLGNIISFLTIIPVVNGLGRYIYGFWYAVVVCILSYIVNIIYYVRRREQIKYRRLVLMKLNWEYIALIYVTIFGYVIIYPYRTYSNYLISQRYNLSLEYSTWILSIIDFICLIMIPIWGIVINKHYKTTYILLPISLFVGCIGYGLVLIEPITSAIFIGLYLSSLSSSIWSYFSYIIPKKHSEMGYGLISSMTNLTLAIMYPLIGYISQSGLISIVIVMMGCSLGSSMVSFTLMIIRFRS
jgi:MFS family permease